MTVYQDYRKISFWLKNFIEGCWFSAEQTESSDFCKAKKKKVLKEYSLGL